MWGMEPLGSRACTSVGNQAISVQCKNAQFAAQDARSAAAMASSFAEQGPSEGSCNP